MLTLILLINLIFLIFMVNQEFISFNEFLLLNGDELQKDCLKEEPKALACPHPKPRQAQPHVLA